LDFENDVNSWLLQYPAGYDAIVQGDFKLQKKTGNTWNNVATLTDNTYGIPYNGDAAWPFLPCDATSLKGTITGPCAVNYQGFLLSWQSVLLAQGTGTYRLSIQGLGPQGVSPGYCLFSPPFCLNEFNCLNTDGTVKFEANYCGGHIGDSNPANQGNSWSLCCNQQATPASNSFFIMTVPTDESPFIFPGTISGTISIGTNILSVDYNGGYNTFGTGYVNGNLENFSGGYLQYLATLINTLGPTYWATIQSNGITIFGPPTSNNIAIAQKFYDTSTAFLAEVGAYCVLGVNSTTSPGTNTVFPFSSPYYTLAFNNGGAFDYTDGYWICGSDLTQIFSGSCQFNGFIVPGGTSIFKSATISAQLYKNFAPYGAPISKTTTNPASTIPSEMYSCPGCSMCPGQMASHDYNTFNFSFPPITMITGDIIYVLLTGTIDFVPVIGNGIFNAPNFTLFNTSTSLINTTNWGKLLGGIYATTGGIFNFSWNDSIRFGGFFGQEQNEIQRDLIKFQNGSIYKIRDEIVRNYTVRTSQLPMWFHQRFYAYALMADTLWVSDYNNNNGSYNYKQFWVVADSNYTMKHTNFSRYPKVSGLKFKEGQQFVYRDRCC